MTVQDITIWRFTIESGNKYLELIPHDLCYFDGKFIGQLMNVDWELPPPIKISGKSKKLPDFVGWMTKCPVVSERAKNILEPIIGQHVQFLPFYDIREKKYFVMNVITLLDDVLDMERSDVFYAAGILVGVRKAFFKIMQSKLLPPIFKLSIDPSIIYVTAPFVQAVIDNKLTGAAMADPKKDALEFILKKQTSNIVIGIPTI